MPFVAEFSTDNRTRFFDPGEDPDQDKGAIVKFVEQAVALAETTGSAIHLQVLHDGNVVHSKSYSAYNALRP
jgi:hypothetical protein